MIPNENARLGLGAFEKAGRLFEGDNTQTTSNLQGLAGPRIERQIERLHAIGPRPTAELLIEIAHRTGQSRFIADRLQAYARLDAEIVRAVGGDIFPPRLLCAVRLNDEAPV